MHQYYKISNCVFLNKSTYKFDLKYAYSSKKILKLSNIHMIKKITTIHLSSDKHIIIISYLVNLIKIK